MDTSIVYDSEDFSENEWTSRKKKQRRDNAKKIMYSCHSSKDKESPKEHHQKVAKRRTFNQELLQLPSLPKPPIISLSSQTSEATTFKAVYQNYLQINLPQNIAGMEEKEKKFLVSFEYQN